MRNIEPTEWTRFDDVLGLEVRQVSDSEKENVWQVRKIGNERTVVELSDAEFNRLREGKSSTVAKVNTLLGIQ